MNFRERFLQKLPETERVALLREPVDELNRVLEDAKKERTITIPQVKITRMQFPEFLPAQAYCGDLWYNNLKRTYNIYTGSRWAEVNPPYTSQLSIFQDKEIINNRKYHMNKTTIPDIIQLAKAPVSSVSQDVIDLAVRRMRTSIDKEILALLQPIPPMIVDKNDPRIDWSKLKISKQPEQTNASKETFVDAYNKAKEVISYA